jgi:hypothetical protein
VVAAPGAWQSSSVVDSRNLTVSPQAWYSIAFLSYSMRLGIQLGSTRKPAARRATETLYRIDPHREPELMGGRYQWRPVRGHESLSWAEERLEELGFKKMQEDLPSASLFFMIVGTWSW